MASSLGRGVAATLLVVLMAIGSVAMWIAAPVFWLWLVSQFSESSTPSLGLYMLVLLGTIATIVVLGKTLGYLNRVHGAMTVRSAVAIARSRRPRRRRRTRCPCTRARRSPTPP